MLFIKFSFRMSLFKNIIIIYGQQLRYFPRWNHRRPVRVLIPESNNTVSHDYLQSKPETIPANAGKVNEEKNQNLDIKGKHLTNKHLMKAVPSVIPISEHKLKVKSKVTHSSKVTNMNMLEAVVDNNGNLMYTKMGNKDIRIYKIMADIKSQNKKNKELILIEGKTLIKEALESKCKLKYILFSQLKDVEDLKPYLPKVGFNLYKMPYKEIQMWSDLVTSPGIMGIFEIPNTEAYKVKNSLPLTIICDNVREPNNLGAILRICSGVGCSKVILTNGCVDLWESKVVRSSAGAHFKLHICKKLNWETIKSNIPEDSNVFIADSNIVVSKNDSKDSLDNLVRQIPVLPYYSLSFKKCKHSVLIIGGETEGISEESFKLACEFKGARLNIPLSNNLDSLNTATALGIIAFEIKRQITNVHIENSEDYKVRNMSLNT